MWELDHKEGWVPKCFWTVVPEKTLESSMESKEIKLVNPKWNQSWIFIGRTDAEAPILWPPDGKNWFIEKDPGAGKDWGQEEKKGMTEDEMVWWHHRLSGHEFEQTLGDSEGQGSLVCHSLWVSKSRTWLSDWTTTNTDTNSWNVCYIFRSYISHNYQTHDKTERIFMTLVWLDCFKVKVKSLSCVRLFATPWTVAHQAPPSMGFSRQEYWSGLPFPSPGDLPNPGIEPRSCALQEDALTSEHQLKVFSVCSIIETLYNLDSHKMK